MIHLLMYPLAFLLGGITVYLAPDLLRWFSEHREEPPLAEWSSGRRKLRELP